jgi:hypothetical protein
MVLQSTVGVPGDAGQHAVLAKPDAAHMGGGRQHGDHQLAVGRRVLGRGADLPAQFGQLRQHGLVQVEQVQRWPALIRLRAMGAPMLPRPMNAIFMTSP